MSDFYFIKNKIKCKANKWKYQEYDKIFKQKDNTDIKSIKEALNKINIIYDQKINTMPKKLNKIQKNRILNDIITTKDNLVKKGFNEKYINSYMVNEHKILTKKNNFID
jgi:hypothetical protein